MTKYLIVKCEELGDQWECDADRTPVCMTDDYEKFNKWGYEIYELLPHGGFKLVKEYDYSSNEGVAIYKWNSTETIEDNPPDIIFEKFKNKNRDFFTKSRIKKLKAEYNLTETVNNIFKEISCFGSYGEEKDGGWFVIGGYIDDFYYLGF